jgi:type VI secretion system protein ImpE
MDRAQALWPDLSGEADGQEFESLRDSDDLVGPVLELIVQGKYTWLPLEQVARLEIDAPRQLRDLMWAPSRIALKDGTKGDVFIPALYTASMASPDEHVKLGRITDWKRVGERFSVAVGARQFAIDNQDKAMLQIRKIVFDPTAERAS